MPFVCCSPELVRSVRCLSASSFSSAPWRRWAGGGGSGVSTLNKRTVSPVRAALVLFYSPSGYRGDSRGIWRSCRRCSILGGLFSLDPCFQRGGLAMFCKGNSSTLVSAISIVVMEVWRRPQGELDEADGVRELTRRSIWRCCGALHGCCPAVDEPPYLLVEGPPFSFLSALKPKGM